MTGAKFDIKKFDGTGDFGLWRIKMHALLIQHGCEAALDVLPVDMEAQRKAELNKKAHSIVIMCLGNKVLREVTRETTAAGVWSKLKTLYMTKSLANKLYMKNKLYTFYMSAGRKISKHIDEFNKIVLDLSNIEVKVKDEDLALLLLTYLPVSYEHFVDTLLYKLKALTLEDVMPTLNSKEIKERSKAKGDDGELNDSVEEKDSLGQVWHKRLRHINEARLRVLEKQGLLSKKSLGKSHRVSFSVGRHTTQGVIDYVHSDLWGPSQVESLRCKRSPSRAIEKKTPMKMWSGHPSDYGILRIFGCVTYLHDKQGKLEPRAVKCILLGYSEGLKGYILYRIDDESPKIVTSKNVVFNESVMYKDMLKDSGAVEEEDTNEPLTYQKEVACEDNSKWKAAMKKEIDSLRKNKTWENLEEVIYMRKPSRYEQDDMLIVCKSKAEIGSTKSLLKKEFDIKELGEAKKILGMEIVRDWSHKIPRVSQSGYISKILNNFRIDNRKSVKMPLGRHFKLSLKDCPVKDCDVERMSKVPYTNAVGSLMQKSLGSSEMDFEIFVRYCKRRFSVWDKSWQPCGRNKFVDSDYAMDSDKGRSITGYAFLVQGCVVS
uniref:Retrovirus-related Pol polyprotein from transposon TNT 1-94 n=1 Tax=Tanacetum cinerariifolium TaxID=118510 RepID=A0A6L2P1Z1_TANCI|nr:retrovirus-related Pol polyprotein from transposon TNT 1-94 [Tanacetum cinerariifolium]